MKPFKIEVRTAEDTTLQAYPRRFDTYTNSIFLTELNPINNFYSGIENTKVQDQFFYKKTIKEKIIVSGTEYVTLKNNIYLDCAMYWVNVYMLCNGEYVFKHRFFFRNKDISFDYDKCQCEIELQVTSIYDSIESNKNTRFKFSPVEYFFDNFLPTRYRISDLCEIANQIIIRMNSGGYENDQIGRLECAISDFFNWQINNGPDYAGNITTGVITDTQQVGGPGFSYLPNYVNPGEDAYFIGMGIKSNIVDPNATSTAYLYNLSFADLEIILRETFNVYWIIEENILYNFPSIGNAIRYIRFEHYSWFQKNVNYDSTSITNFKFNKGKNSFKNKKEDEIGLETWNYNDNVFDDTFKGNSIIYPSCANSTKVKERGTQLITLDFESISAGVGENDDGYMLFDFTFTIMAPPRTILLRTDTVNGTGYYNGRLSVWDLLPRFHKHNRPYKTGLINNSLTSFLSPVFNKIQDNIIVKNCCDTQYKPAESLVKTEMGNGEITKEEIDYKTGQITFTIMNE